MKTTTKFKQSVINATTKKTKNVDGFDRVTLYLDHTELPIEKNLLKQHCTKLKVKPMFMKNNPRWKLKVVLFQPTTECLRLLCDALGNIIGAIITYVEIARDTFANNSEQALNSRNNFLESATMKYQRQTVVRHESTWYYGRRSDEEGNKRGNVLAVYADKPSKLNNARPAPDATPCLHIELRVTGSAALARLGIVTLTDLIEFDHDQFWNNNITFFKLLKPTALGKLLAKIADADIGISGTALRNRANRWISKNSIDGQFVMHNGLRKKLELKAQLETELFTDCLKRMVTESS